MTRLTSPILHFTSQRQRRKQTRNALRMLAASGVLRPSHIELRYSEPMIGVGRLRTPIRAGAPLSKTTVQVEGPGIVTVIKTGLRQWSTNLPSSLLQIMRKPIGPQWRAE